MKIIITALFCTIMVFAYHLGTSIQVSSSQLIGKIFRGARAVTKEYRYMVSLQLNCHHICGASLIKKGILISTRECTLYIAYRMKEQKATAVFGSTDLRIGQRIDILSCVCYQHCEDYDEDIGIIMTADDVDYTELEIMKLYPKPYEGEMGDLCGWGTAKKDDGKSLNFETAEYEDHLYCMPVLLWDSEECSELISVGNYEEELICGKALIRGQKMTFGDRGGPLTTLIKKNGENEIYIVGITLPRIEVGNKTLLRFVRSSIIRDDVEELIEVLKTELENEKKDNSSNSSRRPTLPGNPKKRIKKE